MPGFTPETRALSLVLSAVHSQRPTNNVIRCPRCRAKVYYLVEGGTCRECRDTAEKRKGRP